MIDVTNKEIKAANENDTTLDTSNDIDMKIKETLDGIRQEAMFLGASTICTTIVTMIAEFQSKNGRLTLNDYRRFVKKLQDLCTKGAEGLNKTIQD